MECISSNAYMITLSESTSVIRELFTKYKYYEVFTFMQYLFCIWSR